MSTTFGCDCEFILTLHGQYKSAVPVLKGTREKRERVNGHEIFHDNVLAEIAIAPSRTHDEVQHNFGTALRTLNEMVSPCVLNLAASADYPQRELKDPDAREAGCSEETDAYTRETIKPPEDAIKKTPFRTAGGHIHLGGDGVLQDSIQIKLVVYALDLFVGIPSLFLDNNILAHERRQMYGRAGSFREKSYGLEYRVLSPFWLRSPETVELFYNLSLYAVDFVESGKFNRFWRVDMDKLMAGKKDAYQCYGYDKNLLVKAINEYDMKAAEKFMILLEEFLPNRLYVDLKREMATEPDLYKSWSL